MERINWNDKSDLFQEVCGQLSTRLIISDHQGIIWFDNLPTEPCEINLIGQNFFSVFALTEGSNLCEQLVSQGKVQTEVYFRCKPEAGRHAFGGRAVRDKDHRLMGFMAELRKIEPEEKSNASPFIPKKKVLEQEMHHRIKNHLQIISSTVRIRSREMKDQMLQNTLLDICRMVDSAALVHEAVQESARGRCSSFPNYLSMLTERTIQSYSLDPNKIRLEFDVVEPLLGPDEYHYLTLIVNELISNAFKHSIAHRGSGTIRVIGAPHPRRKVYLLEVSSSGDPFPPGFDFRKQSSLGLRLINIFLRSLKAEIQTVGGGNTVLLQIAQEQSPGV